MVNSTDALLIGVDTASSLAVQQLTSRPITGHDFYENAVASTLWHYALRDPAVDLVGGHNASVPSQLAVKAATLSGLKWLGSWADGRTISGRDLVLYGLSQAGANFLEPYALAQFGDQRPAHLRPATHTPRSAPPTTVIAPTAVPEPDRSPAQNAMQPQARHRGRTSRRF
jgi:hypothetical protein